MLKGFWRNLKWMLATMLAPEYILGKACADLVAAVIARKEMQDFAREDGVEWGLGHCFFANMGGFVLAARGQARPDINSDTLGQTGAPKLEFEIPASPIEQTATDTRDAILEGPAQKLEDKGSRALKRPQGAVGPRNDGKS
jgi:hypothetical protein